MKFKLPATIFFSSLLFAFAITAVNASEGRVELRSTTGEDYRCDATSFYMENSSYNILIGCRGLIYPPDEDLLNYVVWATPEDGGNPQRLGELGVGKALFRTRESFSSLFVTTEQNKSTRSPEGKTVMRGTIVPISFLEKPTTPTPTPEEQESEIVQEQDTSELSTKDRLLLGLKRAGLVSFFALLAVIALVFVITRPRS
jgi:hypothetical protein